MWEKNSDDENLKTTTPNTDMTDQKQQQNVEYFNYFGGMVTVRDVFKLKFPCIVIQC